jgi:cell division control protein 45
MDMDLKKSLIQKLNDVAPEYGLVELSYPSFMRCYGFHSQPLSAADAVEGISALLDVAEGMRMEIEIEGMRNGGEWFGSGKIWEASYSLNGDLKTRSDKGSGITTNPQGDPSIEVEETTDQSKDPQWWVKNFWAAYDALTE